MERQVFEEHTVRLWEETVIIPTYEAGVPDKNPMFLEKRVYQGSCGKVYPYPVIDKIYDEKKDKEYKAVFLENRYLQIMILPELGGRIQRALDKTNSYDFVYYNEVIKPALVGLTGPWISGGIEFNWPQHHRPSTFLPVDYRLQENEDGSKTVWVNEIDSMYGTKGMAGFTLYPDKAYLKIRGQLYNRTALAQTFLWWANPAVPANENTMSVFPPDVHAVYDHGKRDVSEFPIARGTYYKVDYSAGVDISRYKNIPVPTSYMAYRSEYDFVGGYDLAKKAGILHIADHHISPGKKQWTWGNCDFGQAWDRNLTDVNGPYIELMTGVYTDNQPDFTWLKPFEEKCFTQYFMPYKEVGKVKSASADAAVGIEIEAVPEGNNLAAVCVYATGVFANARILLTNQNNFVYLNEIVNISPNDIFKKTVPIGSCEEKDLILAVFAEDGRRLLEYAPEPEVDAEVPEPALPVLPPEQVQSLEELYLIGLHIEQYRHATYDPDPYYLEGLRRDSTDIRLNTAYGTLLLRKGLFAESEPYFINAVKKLQMRNPNPYDSEAMYQLGLTYFYQGNYGEAYRQFRKAAWSNEQQENSYYYVAAIEALKENYGDALQFAELALIKNSRNMKARGLKSTLLRQFDRNDEAAAYIRESLRIDSFDYRTGYEEYLLATSRGESKKAKQLIADLKLRMRDQVNTYLEIAQDFAETGFYREAIGFLCECGSDHPMMKYYEAYYHMRLGEGAKAEACLREAHDRPSLYCFPNKLADILVLSWVVSKNSLEDKAYYYLGNLWYDRKQYDKAFDCFKKSVGINSDFPTAHRNLALIYYNKKQDKEQAREAMEQAYRLDRTDARILLELDQLYKKCGAGAEERMKLYLDNPEAVALRDDLYTEFVTLHNLMGHYEEALRLIMDRQFHPWEGGEGKISRQYILSLTQMARKLLTITEDGSGERMINPNTHQVSMENARLAVSYLERALVYPHNLGEGKLAGAQDNNIHYFLGCAYEILGDAAAAKHHFTLASTGISEPAGMMFYNDQPADLILYQGLANLKLGVAALAKCKFEKLINYGRQHMEDSVKIDFFAVSLPDFLIFEEDLEKKNKVHCHYLMGLGHYGLGEMKLAAEELGKAWELDPSDCGVAVHSRYLT